MPDEANVEELTALNREVLPNGSIKLTAPLGVKDIRNGVIYSEVICKPQNEHYFVENLLEDGENEE